MLCSPHFAWLHSALVVLLLVTIGAILVIIVLVFRFHDVRDCVKLVLKFLILILQISDLRFQFRLRLVLAMIAFLLFDGFVIWILRRWA